MANENQLFPSHFIDNTIDSWLPKINIKSQLIYCTTLAFIGFAIVLLPFIKVDVSIKSLGIIRPITERYELRTLTNGIIDEVKVKEGQKVNKGQPILILRKETGKEKLNENKYEQQLQLEYLHDLTVLSNADLTKLFSIEQLQSPLYKQQYSQFKYAYQEQKSLLEKTKSAFEINQKLFNENVIALKEYQDIRSDYNRQQAATQALLEQQKSTWQADLSKYKVSYNQLLSTHHQLETELQWNEVIAPVSGTIQQFTGRYEGGHLQTSDLLGYISPDSTLIVENYISPKDVGYLKVNMAVIFTVDAFNYNQWGVVTGKVISIDNDFSLQDNKPFYKVRCALNKIELQLKNGYKGQLKKGMTLQTRFILTKRSLFQLLYDKADAWLNPNQSTK